jgi:flagellar basal body-associated protein FliL
MPEVQRGDKKKTKEPSSGPWRALALIVPVVILAAMGGWLWENRGRDSSVPVNGETRIRSTVHLETFVLNLADINQRSYLRVGIDLGLNRELKRGEEPPPVAEVRDTILGVLAEAKVDALLSAEGKSRLKDNVLHALQKRVPQMGVEEVYFTEFLIQR